jgi:hypothetical protein
MQTESLRKLQKNLELASGIWPHSSLSALMLALRQGLVDAQDSAKFGQYFSG